MTKFPKVLFLIVGSMLLVVPIIFIGIFQVEITEKFFPDNPGIFNYILGSSIVLAVLPSLVFAFSGFFKYFLGGSAEKRIIATGRSARAKIVSLSESSGGVITINEQPLVTLNLEVYDGNKPPYQVSLEQIVSRLDIPKLQPGAILAIKIDPNDPMKVVFDPSGAGVVGSSEASTPTFRAEGVSSQDEESIENGIDAQARIISVEDTGKTKDFNPVARITYEVQIPGKNPYTLTKEISLTMQAAQFVKNFVGKTVLAKVHPNDSNKVELKFN